MPSGIIPGVQLWQQNGRLQCFAEPAPLITLYSQKYFVRNSTQLIPNACDGAVWDQAPTDGKSGPIELNGLHAGRVVSVCNLAANVVGSQCRIKSSGGRKGTYIFSRELNTWPYRPLLEKIMTKYLAAAAIVALTVPAFAQATFYIVQDTTTKRCQIVKERPTTKTMVIVGDSGKVYTTEAEAQSAMRTVKVCETK
jgi:hypothetical protein